MEQKKLDGLTTRSLGRHFIWLDEVDSTNNYCKNNVSVLPHGTVVAAGHQTAGRGTRSRTWDSTPGDGLAHSFLLGGMTPVDISILPLLAGLAVVTAAKEEYSVDAAIKWSNDIVVGGKKLCGILCESRIGGGESAAVVGIGVNISQSETDFLDIGLVYATSLLEVTGIIYEPLQVAVDILNRFEPLLDRYLSEGFSGVLRDRYKQHCITLGREVRIISKNGEVTGEAIDIAHDGSLIVLLGGVREVVRAGDVSVRGVYGYV